MKPGEIENSNCMKVLDLEKLSLNYIIQLNQISVLIIEDFNRLTEQSLELSDKSLAWQFSSILSRNPYQSKLFLQCCYLALTERLIKEEKRIDKIIVPSKELKIIINNYFKNNRLQIPVELSNNECLKRKFKAFLGPYYGLYKIILFCWNLFKTRNPQRKNIISKNKPIILLDTFILSNSIKKGQYIDRYYPGLLDDLTDDEQNNIFFFPTIIGKYNSKDITNIFNNSKENLIFKQDYLKIGDYFNSIYSLIKSSQIKKTRIEFKNFDVYLLIRNEYINHKYNKSTLQGLLNFRFFKRLSENNIKMRLAIDWFENQPIDKGFNLGVHTFYPDAEHIGYKGYLISEDFNFYINPTEYEIRNHVIPKELNTIGKELIESNKKYCKNIKVNVAPAFRFIGVWKTKIKKQKKRVKQIILVALPIAYKESLEIVKLIFDANSNKKFINTDFHFKPHPALDFDSVKQFFGDKWPDNFIAVGGDFTEKLLESDILLGNSSSTCMEALAMETPVIIIGSQSNLTQNPIPGTITEKIWKLAYTSEELSEHIEYFLKLDQYEIEELSIIGRKIKEEYFEPVTKENVREFLKLNQ